jgi:cell division protein ZapA (FtsZ GTPase activity inhibitor)
MSELLAINIVIADRTYRLKINRQDEETVRKTVKLINDKIVEFKTSFAGKDMQDYISMALLWFATQFQHTTADYHKEAEVKAQLQAIEKLLAGISDTTTT